MSADCSKDKDGSSEGLKLKRARLSSTPYIHDCWIKIANSSIHTPTEDTYSSTETVIINGMKELKNLHRQKTMVETQIKVWRQKKVTCDEEKLKNMEEIDSMQNQCKELIFQAMMMELKVEVLVSIAAEVELQFIRLKTSFRSWLNLTIPKVEKINDLHVDTCPQKFEEVFNTFSSYPGGNYYISVSHFRDSLGRLKDMRTSLITKAENPRVIENKWLEIEEKEEKIGSLENRNTHLSRLSLSFEKHFENLLPTVATCEKKFSLITAGFVSKNPTTSLVASDLGANTGTV